MIELKGFEEKRGPTRVMGAQHGVVKGRETWGERKAREEAELGATTQPYCLIVGGGQGGVALGARLRRLGVPTIIVDKHERPGDQWRKRYRSLCLHDPVWYDHLPYLPFPDDWPVFSPKDKIGDWLEVYAKIMELDYWGSTECKTRPIRRAQEGMDRRRRARGRAGHAAAEAAGARHRHVRRAEHAEVPGMDDFHGRPAPFLAGIPAPDGYAGKRCVVIGSNNSAHDICRRALGERRDVTMVQRSSTHVCAPTR